MTIKLDNQENFKISKILSDLKKNENNFDKRNEWNLVDVEEKIATLISSIEFDNDVIVTSHEY